jgi:hypothetical protein
VEDNLVVLDIQSVVDTCCLVGDTCYLVVDTCCLVVDMWRFVVGMLSVVDMLHRQGDNLDKEMN